MQKHLVAALAAALSVAGLTAGPSFASRDIVVQPGENMQSISRRYYGDEDHVWAITRYNHLQSPDLIYAGLRLVLPDLAADDGNPVPKANGPAGAPMMADAIARASGASRAIAAAPIPPLPPGAQAGPQATPTVAVPMGSGSPEAQPGASPASNDAAAPERIIQSGLATWYGPGFVGDITYCGDVYDEWAFTAASNTLPCGAVVTVTNQDSGASVRVRIDDRGGFGGAVILDLSRAAFSAIAAVGTGVIAVTVSQAAP